MRAKLILGNEECLLPYNYNYHLSSAIYSAFEESDPQLANYLHRSKEIKLYTFSWILADNRIPKEKGLVIRGDATLYISTPVNLLMEKAVEGSLSKGGLKIGELKFPIKSIEILEEKSFDKVDKRPVTFHTLSPINISTLREKNGGLKQWDLSPEEFKFYENIRKNLIKKYESLNDEKPKRRQLDMKVLNSKPKRLKIRNTYHRAFNMVFKVKGSPGLIKTGYECGFGAKNSMGFGMVETKGC